MSFLRRNREPQPSSVTSPSDPETSRPERKLYHEVVRERLLAATSSHRSFVKEALERGSQEADLPALVADAMTAKVLPRVIRGRAYRGTGVELLLLDGRIPASALRVNVTQSENFFDAHVSLVDRGFDTSGTAANDSEPDTYTVISTGLLPQTNIHDRISPEVLDRKDDVLAQIDVHLAVEEA